MDTRVRVEFQPVGRRAVVAPGTSLLEAARAVGIGLQATCGGTGVCGSCRVRVVTGRVSPVSHTELHELGRPAIALGIRLACQAAAESDLTLDLPADSLTAPQRLQVEAAETGVAIAPAVIPYDLELEPPTLEDSRADATRLRQALWGWTGEPVTIRQSVLAELSPMLRASGWRVRVAVHSRAGRRQVVGVMPVRRKLLGFAVDIGTTKVAMYLVDLEAGTTLASTGVMNPQVAYGEDIISRLAYVSQHADGAALLQRQLLDCLRDGLEDLCRAAGHEASQVVGNTVMHHLFAGLPTAQLGVAPYVAAVSDPLAIPARILGLPLAPGAEVFLPPTIAGFVGADHVAMLLAADAHLRKGTVLALDVGTNTEISLLTANRLLTCSCPSGPAFEGAHLSSGMRAAPGAIEAVVIHDGRIHVRTIGDRPAVGICGSGILDATAAMLSVGMLSERGNFQKDHPLLSDGALLLAPASAPGGRAVTVDRRDVMEVQLAKAAIQAGIGTLLASAGVTAELIDAVIVAGAFGSYLDVRSAIRIGMFPAIPVERYHQVGNAAGLGARQMLLSAERRRIAEALALRAEYLEVSTRPDFTERYLKALWFRGTRRC
jgi:uncharacterized 2Fe-2S/4Fe-4S cluster protein (DUF4445 family)